MAKREKSNREHKKRDYIVYYIVAFVLIFLTASFVIEDVYNNADRLSISSDGVKAIYESNIGMMPFSDQEDNEDVPVTEPAPSTTAN